MLDPKKVRLGMCPIGWSNDDMWDLGDENTFQQCVSEMALAGLPALRSAISIRRTRLSSSICWTYAA